MYINCPLCGDRDIREFTNRGHATALSRPASDNWSAEWDDYVHNRENPAGPTRDLWYHGRGCGAWLVVERNTVTHAITGVTLAREHRDAD